MLLVGLEAMLALREQLLRPVVQGALLEMLGEAGA